MIVRISGLLWTSIISILFWYFNVYGIWIWLYEYAVCRFLCTLKYSKAIGTCSEKDYGNRLDFLFYILTRPNCLIDTIASSNGYGRKIPKSYSLTYNHTPNLEMLSHLKFNLFIVIFKDSLKSFCRVYSVSVDDKLKNKIPSNEMKKSL